MIRTILHYPDPRLREKAEPVTEVTPEIQALVDDMAETMYAAPGCGLAATQIGVNKRVFVIDTATEDEPSRLTVFINPEILEKRGAVTWEEGCLSFPNVHEEIKRAEWVRVRARDRSGKLFELEATGLLAVAIQHESDHLEGQLMIDHLGTLKKRMVQRKMQKRAERNESRAEAELPSRAVVRRGRPEVSNPMRIAHLSDLHVLGDEPVSPLRYFNKRITGYVNLRFRRHAVHKREVVRQLARELASHDVDHVVITGDFSNLALEGEMAAAVRLLEQDLGMTADQISVVPGNHDLYTGGSARSRRFARTFAPFIGSDLPDVAVDHPSGPFPYVRLRGAVALIGLSTALPRPPMMASGSVGRAQRRALEAILAHEEVAKRLPVVLMHHPPHNPVSKLRTFTNGLYDAAELREVLSRARNCLVLHGHLHERTHVTWASDRSELHSVGATSASLLHDHDDRMAGFNLYDLGPAGLHAPPRAIVHVPDGPFVERAIPRRDQLSAISYQPSARPER